jgi:flavodoxin
MKKAFLVLMSAAMVFALAACGGNGGAGSGGTGNGGTGNGGAGAAGAEGKILVAYFSMVGNADFPAGADAVTSSTIRVVDGGLVGNNRIIADMVVEMTGGDLHSIRTVKTYPSNDREIVAEAMTESASGELPELVDSALNVSGYDVVVLIYPNWADTIPMAIRSFLDKHDFSGKTIAPVCTFGGSGLGRSVDDIRSLCPDATVPDALGVRVAGVETAQNDVRNWLRSIGLYS